MFVLNAFSCRELKFVAILRAKLRFLLRNIGVDRFYSEFLRKNLAAEVSDSLSVLSFDLTILSGSAVDTKACRSEDVPHNSSAMSLLFI